MQIDEGFKVETEPTIGNLKKARRKMGKILRDEHNAEEPERGWSGMIDTEDMCKVRANDQKATIMKEPPNPNPNVTGLSGGEVRQKQAQQAHHTRWINYNTEIVIATNHFSQINILVWNRRKI